MSEAYERSAGESGAFDDHVACARRGAHAADTMSTSPIVVRVCLPALILALGGACGSPPSPGGGDEAGKGATLQPEPVKPEPAPAQPTIHPPQPGDSPLLVVDPKQPQAAKPLPGIPVYACQDAEAKPLRCGLAARCEDLAARWVEQLHVGKTAKAEVAKLEYPEGPCPDPTLVVPPRDDFARGAAVLEHRLGVLVDDEVAELLIRTTEGWRSVARITEVAATGMASQEAYRPVASWQHDVDGDPGAELVVLIRGRDSGHAAKADPFTRAWIVVCDGHDATCRRLEVGQWLEGTHEEYATPEQLAQAWSGVVRFYAGGELELDADDDAHDLPRGHHELAPADGPLVVR